MPKIIMPKMGDGMEEGTLLRWLKEVGEEVELGEPLAEIETDKVALELESGEAGILLQTLVEEGETVPIGTAIAAVGQEGEKIEDQQEEVVAEVSEESVAAAEAAASEDSPADVAASSKDEPAQQQPREVEQTPSPAPDRAPGERLRASPIVKRLAAEHGIDLSAVQGTGPGGRIVKEDLKPYLTGARPAPSPAEAAPAAPAPSGPRPTGVPREMSTIRQRTGQRMKESKDVIPHFYVSSEIEMGSAMAFRKQINDQVEDDGSRVSINDLVVKSVAKALRDFPNLNTSLEGDTLYDHENIDINVAVAIENGLIAPFVPDADKQSLTAIARMTKDLIGRAREGGLTPEEYQGGTFTITNLGMMDVVDFVAIINPPQAAILAIGSIYERPVVEDGEVTVGQRMKVALSADHRITDGAEVAEFLQAVKKYLQNPLLMVV